MHIPGYKGKKRDQKKRIASKGDQREEVQGSRGCRCNMCLGVPFSSPSRLDLNHDSARSHSQINDQTVFLMVRYHLFRSTALLSLGSSLNFFKRAFDIVTWIKNQN